MNLPGTLDVAGDTARVMQEAWDLRAHTKASAMFFIVDQFRGTPQEFYKSGEWHWEDLKFALRKFVGRDYVPHGVGVEIGCGIGRMTVHACWDFKFLYATDISSKMIDLCPYFPNVQYAATPTLKGVVPPGSADLVFSHIVMQHLPKQVFWQYVWDAYSALKYRGIFITQLAEGVMDHPDDETLLVRGYTNGELMERLRGDFGFWNALACLEEAGLSEPWKWLVLEKADGA